MQIQTERLEPRPVPYREWPHTDFYYMTLSDLEIVYKIAKTVHHPLKDNPHAAQHLRLGPWFTDAVEQAILAAHRDNGYPEIQKAKTSFHISTMAQLTAAVQETLAETFKPHTIAASKIGAWAWRNASTDNEQVRSIASEMMLSAIRYGRPWLNAECLKKFKAIPPNPAPEVTERWIRRQIRKNTRQARETAALINKDVGERKQKCVSDFTLRDRQSQLLKQEEWIDASILTCGEKSIPMASAIRTKEARVAELFTIMKGVEDYATTMGLVGIFITLTVPPGMHANPIHGGSWDGSLPTNAHEFLTTRWKWLRAWCAKEENDIHPIGLRVTEPHQDGTPHWHLVAFVKPEDKESYETAIEHYFGHSPKAVKIENVDRTKGSAAGYMLKYITKNIRGATTITSGDTDNTDIEATKELVAENAKSERVDAWRSTWNVRAFQFFGLQGCLGIWREMRRIEIAPKESHITETLWRAARKGDAQTFLAYYLAHHEHLAKFYDEDEEVPYFDTLEPPDDFDEEDDDELRTKTYTKKGRLLGLLEAKNGILYYTHKQRWTIDRKPTTNDDSNEKSSAVTVIHKGPRVPTDDSIYEILYDSQHGNVKSFQAFTERPPPSGVAHTLH